MQERYLQHHGIKGQKWGVRNFQNPDGTLTPAGRRRYGADKEGNITSRKGIQKRLNEIDQDLSTLKQYRSKYSGRIYDRAGQLKNLSKEKKFYTEGSEGFKVVENKEKQILKKYEEDVKNFNDVGTLIERGQKETKQLLQTARNQGYSVKSKRIDRMSQRGEDIALMLFAYNSGMLYMSTVPGTKYKVRETEKSKALKKNRSE